MARNGKNSYIAFIAKQVWYFPLEIVFLIFTTRTFIKSMSLITNDVTKNQSLATFAKTLLPGLPFIPTSLSFHTYQSYLPGLQVLHPLSQPTPFIYIVYINVTYIICTYYMYTRCDLSFGMPKPYKKASPMPGGEDFPKKRPKFYPATRTKVDIRKEKPTVL